MDVFDRQKNRRRNHDYNWVNGIDVPRIEAPDYRNKLLSTPEEAEQRTQRYMQQYEKAMDAFKRKTSLTTMDMTFLILAALLQTLRWALISNDKLRFDKASDADKVLDKANRSIQNSEYIPASIQQIIADCANHTVPYDAIQRSSRFKDIYSGESTGLAGSNHRILTLGHDPLAGLVVGTANIATNTLTVNEFTATSWFPSYHVVNQQINGKTDLVHIMKWSRKLLNDKPEIIGASLIRQVIHCGTDMFTKQGLPIPVINVISPEASSFLVGANIDVYSVARGAALAILINKIIEMLHRLFFDRSCDDEKLYEVRTRKVLMYSNTLSSILNGGAVGFTGNFKKLDVGGHLVTLRRIWNDSKKYEKSNGNLLIKLWMGN